MWSRLSALHGKGPVVLHWNQVEDPSQARRLQGPDALANLLRDPGVRDSFFPVCDGREGMIFGVVGEYYFVCLDSDAEPERSLALLTQNRSS